MKKKELMYHLKRMKTFTKSFLVIEKICRKRYPSYEDYDGSSDREKTTLEMDESDIDAYLAELAAERKQKREAKLAEKKKLAEKLRIESEWKSMTPKQRLPHQRKAAAKVLASGCDYLYSPAVTLWAQGLLNKDPEVRKLLAKELKAQASIAKQQAKVKAACWTAPPIVPQSGVYLMDEFNTAQADMKSVFWDILLSRQGAGSTPYWSQIAAEAEPKKDAPTLLLVGASGIGKTAAAAFGKFLKD